MEHDKKRDQDRKPEKQGRGWTVRVSGPIRYRRFTDTDAGGRPSIFFKFEGDDDKLPEEVYTILREMKYLNRSPEHGGGRQATALTFNRSKKHGRVWRMPDTETGRTAADIIDGRLADLATRIDNDLGNTR